MWPKELQELLQERLREVPGRDSTIRSNELALSAVFSGEGLWSEFYLTPTGECIIMDSIADSATTITAHDIIKCWHCRTCEIKTSGLRNS